MESLWQDVRYGIRTFKANPGFTVVSILALAVGIGCNTAVFSIINAIILRPLPFPEPERLVQIWSTSPGRGLLAQAPLSWQRFHALEQHGADFDSLGAFAGDAVNLVGHGEPEQLNAMRVSSGVFDVFRVRPIVGRRFLPEEDKEGGPPVAIISYGLWRRVFGGDRAVVNKSISLDGTSYQVVGVMPGGFESLGFQPDVWLPRVFDSSFISRDLVEKGAGFLAVIGRLKPGKSRDQAEQYARMIAAHTKIPGHPDSDFGVQVLPLLDQVTGNIGPLVFILFASVAMVLLIACANVANLLLAKAVARQKEITIRAALGAGRSRILRQLITESVLLALAACGLGVLLAAWGISLLAPAAANNLPRASEVNIDARVLVFTLAVSVVTGFLFGLAPALRLMKADLNDSLKDASRGTTGGQARTLIRSVLVALEVGMSVLLLVVAGLLLRSFVRLQSVDPGFDSHNLLIANIKLPRPKYNELALRSNFYRQVVRNLSCIPGVAAVATSEYVPLSGNGSLYLVMPEGPAPLPLKDRPVAFAAAVSNDYFKAMRIRLVEGRVFNDEDTDSSPPVAIIGQGTAHRLFPGLDPVGRHLLMGAISERIEIIGVVGDVKVQGLANASPDTIYTCAAQHPSLAMSVVIRTNGKQPGLEAAIRERVAAIDSQQPVANFQTMDSIVAASIAQPHVTLLMIGIFAAIALLLAASGIYSVISYAVSQRTGELGLRMALGASSGALVRLVVRQGMKAALVGMVLGLAGAALLTRLMQSMLFSINAIDPVTFVATPLLLGMVALMACALPGARATRVNPIAALRYE